ncbi:MAG: DNA methyltransferase [Ignavibacteriales bacterium]|nr:DNA methyltransferase [Ignavibacteriales bacterium]
MPTPARTYPRRHGASNHHLIDRLFDGRVSKSDLTVESLLLSGEHIRRFTAEFWTPRQRQASSLHEISYRACFKPQLPRFFIDRMTGPGDVVYDPFMGRGTTPLEAALLDRNVIATDANPLSRIFMKPRLNPPTYDAVERRLEQISVSGRSSSSLDLSMFYHPRTEKEILALRRYLARRSAARREDAIDRWIRMVATNRLTGHSRGFFSVYTLPPNQAMSAENQRRVNRNRKQKPEYRDVRELILRKTRSLLRNVTDEQMKSLANMSRRARFVTGDARSTPGIADNSIRLTVTSPPFLDTVNYAKDNWLRCWFNGMEWEEIGSRLTVVRSLDAWIAIISGVFRELYRVTSPDGVVAFEVGEIRKRNLMLDEVVVPMGIQAGFRCAGILVNQQKFTKTSNIWGVRNNRAGTNTNRIVLFHKSHSPTK